MKKRARHELHFPPERHESPVRIDPLRTLDEGYQGYPGGKNGAGVYQRIICLQPPHDVYIEAFLGGGAVWRHKRPARLNIGLDVDRHSLSLMVAADLNRSAEIVGNDVAREVWFQFDARAQSPGMAVTDPQLASTILASGAPLAKFDDGTRYELRNADGIEFLASYPWTGSELAYLDPPYMHATRNPTKLRIYLREWTDRQHRQFLRVCRSAGDRGGRLMISGYPSALYDRELRGWNVVSYQAMTRGGLRDERLWFNYPEPVALHDYRYLGKDFRERERIKRKMARWRGKLARMPLLERQAIMAALSALG